jgi:hypothetical protein
LGRTAPPSQSKDHNWFSLLIDDKTGETELMAIPLVNCYWQFFYHDNAQIGEGEMIQCKHLCQLDKPVWAALDKVIIEVVPQPKAIS